MADMSTVPHLSGTVSQSLTRVKTGSWSSLISNVSSSLGGTSQSAVLPFLYRTWWQGSPMQDTSSPVSLFREATQQKGYLYIYIVTVTVITITVVVSFLRSILTIAMMMIIIINISIVLSYCRRSYHQYLVVSHYPIFRSQVPYMYMYFTILGNPGIYWIFQPPVDKKKWIWWICLKMACNSKLPGRTAKGLKFVTWGAHMGYGTV